MKKSIFLLFFLLLTVACGAPAVTTPQLAAPEVVLASPTSLPIIQPTFTPMILVAPTSTLEIPSPTQSSVQAVIVPTSTTAPQTLPSNEIKFGVGGTWKDTQDSIVAGGSKTYTLNAMQGQIMSVSILGGYFPLQIQGRDGTVLCPVTQNTECSFWRGTLPLSQDYYITVKSGGMGTDFTLRVAINPPGKSEQVFSYNSSNVSLSYPDQFAPAQNLSMLNNKTNPQLTLQFIDTSSYVNTNLGETYFVVGSSSDPQVVATCTQPNQNGGGMETPNGNVTVNGYNFTYSTASDAGAGNIYDQYIYRVVNHGACYEAIFFIHSSNIGNYTPGTVKEFDLENVLQKLNGILSTLRLK